MYSRRILLTFGFLLLVALSGFGQGMKVKFIIDGNKEKKARVIGMIGDQNYLVDTLEADPEGVFTLQRTKAIPGGLYYFVLPDNTYLQFLYDGEPEITFKTTKAKLVEEMVIEGSENNELFYQNLNFEANFQADIRRIEDGLKNKLLPDKEIQKLKQEKEERLQERKDHLDFFFTKKKDFFFSKFKLAGQNPDLQYPKKPNGDLDTTRQLMYYRLDYWDGVDFSDERLLRTPVISNKLINYMTKITPQNIDTLITYADIVTTRAQANKEMFKFVANWIAIKYRKPKIMGLEAVYVFMVQKFFTEELAFWSTKEELKKIRDEANEMAPSLLGKTAQNIVCTNLAGEKEGMYSLKSKVTILYMYSYNCSHCRERTPVLLEVFNKWKDKGLDVYALCLEDDEQAWRDFVKNYGIEAFHNVWDPKYESRYYRKYHIDVTPEVYVMDENWKIISKDLHPNQLESTLKKYLDK